MPEQSLTGRERSCLFALMAAGTAVSNGELRARAGVELSGEPRRRLNEFKLVESQRAGRGFMHELSEKGWAWCWGAMAEPLPEGRDATARVMQAIFLRLRPYFESTGVRLADVFGPATGDVGLRIRDAYSVLTPEPGAWVRLARLRERLADVAPDDLDEALRRLNREPDVFVFADADQRRLTAQDRAAAVRIGGEDKHLLKVEGS